MKVFDILDGTQIIGYALSGYLNGACAVVGDDIFLFADEHDLLLHYQTNIKPSSTFCCVEQRGAFLDKERVIYCNTDKRPFYMKVMKKEDFETWFQSL